ncbi:splicing factor U2af large subunit B-like isoform X2 [Gastrolobium bilobum]|uniref:splicing factor U2af large subunit B-like isoform X2 n=1 Tax=Gastrolobium bilobum TaxID=150636 RepID=UPI002AB22AD5|nr:splicing factor U2af large subunit B-like isoform X2 [Gastrolobium bilobum]
MSDIENHASLRGGSSPDEPVSRGSAHKSLRMRERDGERKPFHNRHHRDYRDGGFKGRGKYDSYNRHRSRDYDRHNDHVRDGDTRHKYGAYSKRSRGESRSRSRSPSRSECKKTSGFDLAPPAAGVTPGVSGQMLGINQMIQGTAQNLPQFGISQIGAFSLMQVQPMTQQATRHARRVYVGGLPPLTNEQSIAAFFSHVMIAIGGNSTGTGDSVVNVYINHEKKFAFVEMRTVEEASNAMALDGIIFEGVAVRVRRPTDYNPSLAAALGPSQPSPYLNLSAVGLSVGAIGGTEGLDRIFVGGLPYYFTEEQMKELLQAFGPLRAFDIVRDKDTGNSKGYGFCIYQDPAVTDIACASLNGLKMGDKTLTVRRATVSGHSKTEQEHIFARAQQHIAMQKVALEVGGLNILGMERVPTTNDESPTKVLCLTQAVTTDQLMDDMEYKEILEDMRDECCKFGTLLNVVIPRPKHSEELPPGIGKVFLEYSDTAGCSAAKNALNGRKFGGNIVTAVYFPEEKYLSMEYDI